MSLEYTEITWADDVGEEDASWHPPQEDCVFCPRPAVLLCDYLLGVLYCEYTTYTRTRTGKAGKVVRTTRKSNLIDDRNRVYRCDMPMCESCATQHGRVFYNLGEDGHHTDTRDNCPIHRGVLRKSTKEALVTEAEASDMRRAVYVMARSGRGWRREKTRCVSTPLWLP